MISCFLLEATGNSKEEHLIHLRLKSSHFKITKTHFDWKLETDTTVAIV